MKAIIVTTSWDDGHKLDLRIVELLDRHGLKGTFYIAKRCLDEQLCREEIARIDAAHEIGAHSLTHRRLDQLSFQEAYREIKGSKDFLENLLGHPVNMFCYPGGFYNEQTLEIVESSGFIGARTVEKFCVSVNNPYLMGTTVHCYPHPLRKVSKNRYMLNRYLLQPLQQNYQGIRRLRLPLTSYFSWIGLAKATFDYVRQNGGIWHLWGHSWEIEKYGMWNDLEEILSYVANREAILYLTNGEVIERFASR